MEAHLSRNDSTFRYSETTEEYFYDKIRELTRLEDIIADHKSRGNANAEAAAIELQKAAIQAESEKERLAQQAKQKYQPVHRLMTAKHTRQMCAKLARFGPHFRTLPEMKLSYLKTNMFNIYGGV